MAAAVEPTVEAGAVGAGAVGAGAVGAGVVAAPLAGAAVDEELLVLSLPHAATTTPNPSAPAAVRKPRRDHAVDPSS
jgi:hypothetical protein